MNAVLQVVVNGEPREVGEGATVASLLGDLALAGQPVAVERNLEIVPKSAHAATVLQDGDRIEIVTMVGGG